MTVDGWMDMRTYLRGGRMAGGRAVAVVDRGEEVAVVAAEGGTGLPCHA